LHGKRVNQDLGRLSGVASEIWPDSPISRRVSVTLQCGENQLAIFIEATPVSALLTPATVLLLPIALTLCIRWVVLQSQEGRQKTVWATYRSFAQLILAATVAGWWVIWSMHGRAGLDSIIIARWPGAAKTSVAETLLFWLPPTVSLGIFLLLCYAYDQGIFRLKWTIANAFRQAWWRLVSFVIPLLLVAAGFEAILQRKVRGIAWLLVAGVVSKVGTGFLRRSQGMKFNKLKSGELRNRALSMASRMGVTLDRVYVVPAGKGHLTNAYGISNAIALTDNLGKYLTKTQLEFVMAHELAHVKLKHVRKYFLLGVAVFSITGVLLFWFSQRALPLRPLLQLVAMIGPLVTLYYCSRRFEYSADEEAVDFTGDPETAIWALANLRQSSELPAAYDRLTELFATHPTLAHRVHAIANDGRIPADRLTDILKEAGILLSAAQIR
jgi:Zn-dependent protease with chaperone function